MSKIDPNKIHLLNIKTLKNNVSVTEDFRKKDVHAFGVKFGQKSLFSAEKKLFRITLSVLLNALNKKDEELGGKAEFELRFIFEIENLEELSEKNDEGVLIVETALLHTLGALSFSTARGIIYSATVGSPIGPQLLHIISPSELFQNQDSK